MLSCSEEEMNYTTYSPSILFGLNFSLLILIQIITTPRLLFSTSPITYKVDGGVSVFSNERNTRKAFLAPMLFSTELNQEEKHLKEKDAEVERPTLHTFTTRYK